MKSHCFLLTAAILISAATAACSQNKAETSSETPTPTPMESVSPSPTATITPIMTTPATKPFADVNVRLRDLDAQLDKMFSESLNTLGSDFSHATLASSVDVREQKDNYVVRVYVPNGDTSKVTARIDNGALRIIEPGEKAAGANQSFRYEQVIGLSEPVRSNQMKIDRKQNLVVITIPKSTPRTVAAASPTATATPASPPVTTAADLNERVIDQMTAMQRQMDRIFHNAFPNDMLNGANELRLGSAMNIDDQKDKYIVHFYLPDRDLKNIDVNFNSGRLTLSAQEKENVGRSS